MKFDNLKKVWFSLEEEPIYIGYIYDGEHWNGWLCPYVTKEVFDLIINYFIVKRKFDSEGYKFYEDEENPWLDLAKTKPSEDGLYDISHGFIWSITENLSRAYATDEQIIGFYYDLVSLGNQMLAENQKDKSKFYFAELKKVNKIIKLRNLSVEESI